MSPLPRFLALALFVVMTALFVLLVIPVWRDIRPNAPRPGTAAAVDVPQRMVVLSQRLALGLALVSAGIAAALVVSLGYRRHRRADTPTPFASARGEMGALTRLAQSSVAQGEALDRERDVRRRAEEDAQLKQQLLAHSLDEKVRLGRDLHDGIIQSLYAVGLTVESARVILREDPAEADQRLEKSRAALNNAIREVRAYITGLTPGQLHRAGFTHAVNALATELGAGRTADFDVKIDEDATARLTAEQAVEALQITREAISNALRHGGASRVTVRVHQSDHEVCLLVQDNGTGFDAAARREGGHGLGNMHARAGRVGATLRVTSRPGEGSRVIATLPIVSPPSV